MLNVPIPIYVSRILPPMRSNNSAMLPGQIPHYFNSRLNESWNSSERAADCLNPHSMFVCSRLGIIDSACLHGSENLLITSYAFVTDSDNVTFTCRHDVPIT